MGGMEPVIAVIAFTWLTTMFGFTVMLGTGGRVRPVQKLPVDPASLHPYELAYLAAGPARVADTVLVWLLERGTLQGTQDGPLTYTGEEPDPRAGPLEAAAIELVSSRSGRATAVRSGLTRCPAMGELRQRLREKGLLMGWIGRLIAGVRLYATLVFSLAVLIVPPALLVGNGALSHFSFHIGMLFFVLLAVPFVLIAVTSGVGGLQMYLGCRHLLHAGIRRRARHTVASARALMVDPADGSQPDNLADSRAQVALNGPGASESGIVLGPLRNLLSSDQQHDGGLLKYIGRGKSGHHGSSEGTSGE